MKRVLFIGAIFLLHSCYILNPVRKSPYKTFVENSKNKPFDVIIVPGIPYNGKNWNRIMKQRILWSVFLYQKGYTKNIIYSGAAVHTHFIESRIMALYAKELGVPSEHLFTEEKAEHTTENLYYSYKMANAAGFKNIALATDPYQSNNLRGFIKKQKISISILPILYDSTYILPTKEPQIQTRSAKTDSATFVSINKREGFFKRLRGTLGKNIKYTDEDKSKGGSQ